MPEMHPFCGARSMPFEYACSWRIATERQMSSTIRVHPVAQINSLLGFANNLRSFKERLFLQVLATVERLMRVHEGAPRRFFSSTYALRPATVRSIGASQYTKTALFRLLRL